MRNILQTVFLVILFIGCTKKFEGRIEERFGSYYLVNASPSQTFRFTVKKTEIEGDSFYTYATSLIVLAPGDEKPLGKKYFKTTETLEPSADTSETHFKIQIFTPTPEQLEESKKRNKVFKNNKLSEDAQLEEALKESLRNENDTMINGHHMMYRYILETKPPAYSIHKYHDFFEITGQTKIDQKK